LPFSAGQSDAISSDNNKVHIRQHGAAKQGEGEAVRQMVLHRLEQQQQLVVLSAATRRQQQLNTRRVVGKWCAEVEMLVGGVPINADPPQPAVGCTDHMTRNWGVISLSTRDFGPLLHAASTAQVSTVEKGLFVNTFLSRHRHEGGCCRPKDHGRLSKSFRYAAVSIAGRIRGSGNLTSQTKDMLPRRLHQRLGKGREW
jgi:hypothetical protein